MGRIYKKLTLKDGRIEVQRVVFNEITKEAVQRAFKASLISTKSMRSPRFRRKPAAR